MSKIIDMDEFKKKKRGAELRLIVDNTLKEADESIEKALEEGVCDGCGDIGNELSRVNGRWLCRACLGL